MNSKPLLAALLALQFFAAANGVAQVPANPADLSAADIIRRTQDKYADLISYRDEGATVSTLGQTIASSLTFTLKLGRTNLYQVVWQKAGGTGTGGGMVWSAGNGDFMWLGKGSRLQKIKDLTTTLASATGLSGGAAGSIPGTFFNLGWGGQLGTTMMAATRSPDDKVGLTDCYVLTHGSGGRTNTLWIGKTDFLIHQIENFTSGAVVKTVLEAQARQNPQLQAMLDDPASQLTQNVDTIETHNSIVINQPLTPADFDFQVPPEAKE